MPDPSEAISAAVRNRVRAAVSSVVDGLKDELKQQCQVPVGYAGKRIIRSKPGEPPRRETGDYRDGFSSFVEDRLFTVHGEAGHSSDLATWLEEGTENMEARPHFRPVYDNLAATGKQRFTDALNNQ